MNSYWMVILFFWCGLTSRNCSRRSYVLPALPHPTNQTSTVRKNIKFTKRNLAMAYLFPPHPPTCFPSTHSSIANDMIYFHGFCIFTYCIALKLYMYVYIFFVCEHPDYAAANRDTRQHMDPMQQYELRKENQMLLHRCHACLVAITWWVGACKYVQRYEVHDCTDFLFFWVLNFWKQFHEIG